MSRWKAIGVVVEGQPIDVGGLDPWSHTWVPTTQAPVYLPHPSHPAERHTMHIYEIRSGKKTVTFAAGELSANVWGFYAPSNNALERTRDG
jgi:hypothetical protein